MVQEVTIEEASTTSVAVVRAVAVMPGRDEVVGIVVVTVISVEKVMLMKSGSVGMKMRWSDRSRCLGGR